MKLTFEFERGGLLTASLGRKGPETAKAVAAPLRFLPAFFRLRWSGKEIFVPIDLATKPPRENQTIRAALGDVIYFQEWEGGYERQVSKPLACSTATRSCASGVAMRPVNVVAD